MADTTTSVYQFVLPEVGSSDDTWGDKLNADLAKLELLLVSGFTGGTPTDIGKLKNSAFQENSQISGTSPQLRFLETDAIAPAGRYRFAGFSAGTFAFQRDNAPGDWSTASTIWSVDEASGLFTLNLPIQFAGSANHIRMKDSGGAATGYGVFLRNDVTSFYFLLTNNNDADGSFNGLRPFTIDKSNGFVTMANANFAIASVVSASPQLRFDETDQAGAAGKFRFIVSSGIFSISRNTDVTGGWATAATIAIFDPEGTAMTSVQSVVTQQKGDARYGNLDLVNTWTGIQTIESGGPSLRFKETDAVSPAGQFAFFGSGTGNFSFQRYTAANFASGTNIWFYTFSNNTFNIAVPVDATSTLDVTGTLTALGSAITKSSHYVSSGNVVVGSESASGSELVAKVIIGGAAMSIRRGGTANQTHITFINNALVTPTTVGTINTSGSTTAYNTTSDENLKDFTGLLDPQRAIDILRADPPREFDWKDGSGHAVGWGAQTSYAISPDLASPPPEWERNEDVHPGVTEAPKVGEPGYQPWGMDLSKRVPYLAAALVRALDLIDALTARVAALEA